MCNVAFDSNGDNVVSFRQTEPGEAFSDRQLSTDMALAEAVANMKGTRCIRLAPHEPERLGREHSASELDEPGLVQLRSIPIDGLGLGRAATSVGRPSAKTASTTMMVT